MKRYIGERHGAGDLTRVLVDDGKVRAPLEHFVRHSPTGFEWGYGGSGPSDLARCILIEHFACFTAARRNNVDDGTLQRVERLYQPFKFAAIADLPREGFELTTEQIEDVLAEVEG